MTDIKNLTRDYEEKHINRDNLYKSYILNKRSFDSKYKTIRNYKFYSNQTKTMVKFVKKIQKEFKQVRMKGIAHILDVSINVDSAFEMVK